MAVPAIGALACAALALFGRLDMAAGAAAGAVIVSVSWIGMNVLGRRLIPGGQKGQMTLAAVMGFKLMLSATLVFVAVHLLHFDGYGMAVGLSALPMGIVVTFAVSGPGKAPGGADGGDQPVTEVKGDA